MFPDITVTGLGAVFEVISHVSKAPGRIGSIRPAALVSDRVVDLNGDGDPLDCSDAANTLSGLSHGLI